MNTSTKLIPNNRLLFTLFISTLFIFTFMKVWDGKKQVDTSKRDTAYKSRIARLNNAEQYALVANASAYYPCYHCKKPIFYLQKNEVWKYGVTINGKSGRYNDEFFIKHNVTYVVEHEGTVQACLEEEARKIILYYLLPENMIRNDEFKLARPPGNSKDQ